MSAAVPAREVAIIVDTSGSMEQSDSHKYTAQTAKIISDLVQDGDHLTIVRMAAEEGMLCKDRANSSLAIQFTPADRGGFQNRLDGFLTYSGGTYFAAAIRTAAEVLQASVSEQKLLLILSDEGGLGQCSSILTQDLVKLRDSGVLTAAVNLGGGAGAFAHNPGVATATSAANSGELVLRVGEIYQRFLGRKRIASGVVRGPIEVDLAPFTREAFLLVAADGPVSAIRVESPNPGAAAVQTDYRTGNTIGLDRVDRAYRIVRLRRPNGGKWSFRVEGSTNSAGWLLLEDSSIGVRLRPGSMLAAGKPSLVQAELYDTETGLRISPSSGLGEIEVAVDLNGQTVNMRDDGTQGDMEAGDGTYSALITSDTPGTTRLTTRIRLGDVERIFAYQIETKRVAFRLVPLTADRGRASRPLSVRVKLERLADGSPFPEHLLVETLGATTELRTQTGETDSRASDRTYTGSLILGEGVTQDLAYRGEAGELVDGVTQKINVEWWAELPDGLAIDFGRLGSRDSVQRELDLTGATWGGQPTVRITADWSTKGTSLEMLTGGSWRLLGSVPVEVRLASEAPQISLRLRAGACPVACAPQPPHTLALRLSSGQTKWVRVHAEVIKGTFLACYWCLPHDIRSHPALLVGVSGDHDTIRLSTRQHPLLFGRT